MFAVMKIITEFGAQNLLIKSYYTCIKLLNQAVNLPCSNLSWLQTHRILASIHISQSDLPAGLYGLNAGSTLEALVTVTIIIMNFFQIPSTSAYFKPKDYDHMIQVSWDVMLC
jgi:hypothetical protein